MSRIIATAALALLATMSQAAELLKGDAAAGEGKAVTCGACHGADGNSVVPNFPKLAGLGEKYLLKQMQDIRDGRRMVAAMAGQVDNMTDQDLADIAAFYDEKERTSEMADEELVELGRKVYMSGIMERKVAACSGCHSPSGKGNGPAGFPGLGSSQEGPWSGPIGFHHRIWLVSNTGTKSHRSGRCESLIFDWYWGHADDCHCRCILRFER